MFLFVFILVSEGKYCSDLQLDPVCDTENRQHPNLCSLQFNRKSLGYRGFCKVGDLTAFTRYLLPYLPVPLSFILLSCISNFLCVWT